ncbi:MAG: ComF family protein [Desulfobacterales bacterium]|nr:ComF family protein [Desulfobacterales bacterium]
MKQMSKLGRTVAAYGDWSRTLLWLKQILYPAKCLKCNVYMTPKQTRKPLPEDSFCPVCLADGWDGIDPPYCILCGIQLPGAAAPNHVCGPCLKTPLNMGKVRAAVEYKGLAKDAISLFKYHSKLSLCRLFESMMFQTFARHFDPLQIDLLMPVPLHPKKLKHRGFNQAYLLVRSFEKMSVQQNGCPPSWRIDLNSLERRKETRSQTGLDIGLRKKNLKGAFHLRDESRIKGKTILLIDDVLTTGATCNEAARLLLAKGAQRVDALVLARA